MDLRVLRYFLMIAREQSFTRAAEQLHITQPTLSRQIADLEKSLGISLFERNGKKLSLTQEGILLKRRAMEILDLEEQTLQELKHSSEVVEGTVNIGCGEFTAMERLAEICRTYKEKYPKVQIVLHTATADAVYEMLNRGLVDVGLFLEPVVTEGLDYIRLEKSDFWMVMMPAGDPLAEKTCIVKEDLIDKPLILPKRLNIQSEIANWFGKDFERLQISMISNLGTNAAVMVKNGLGYMVSIEGAAHYWSEDMLVRRKLYPEITANTIVAWRRNVPCSQAVQRFLDEIHALKA